MAFLVLSEDLVALVVLVLLVWNSCYSSFPYVVSFGRRLEFIHLLKKVVASGKKLLPFHNGRVFNGWTCYTLFIKLKLQEPQLTR
jgi:hypothetical protein